MVHVPFKGGGSRRWSASMRWRGAPIVAGRSTSAPLSNYLVIRDAPEVLDW